MVEAAAPVSSVPLRTHRHSSAAFPLCSVSHPLLLFLPLFPARSSSISVPSHLGPLPVFPNAPVFHLQCKQQQGLAVACHMRSLRSVPQLLRSRCLITSLNALANRSRADWIMRCGNSHFEPQIRDASPALVKVWPRLADISGWIQLIKRAGSAHQTVGRAVFSQS